MLLVVFMLDSDYSPSSVTTNNINGLVRFAGRPNLLSARVPLHSVFTLRTKYLIQHEEVSVERNCLYVNP